MVFATGNSGKLREASEILGKGFELVTPAEMGINEDIPETGATLRANSQQKADYILEKCGTDCFADDTGLEVDALGGAPGVHTARYAGEDKNFDRNMDKLLEELSRKEMEASLMKSMGIAPKKNLRKARFRSVITLILGGKRHFFDGILEVLGSGFSVKTSQLLRSKCVYLRADSVCIIGNFKSGTFFCTLKKHVFYKMRNSVFLICFVYAARLYEYAARNGKQPFHFVDYQS